MFFFSSAFILIFLPIFPALHWQPRLRRSITKSFSSRPRHLQYQHCRVFPFHSWTKRKHWFMCSWKNRKIHRNWSYQRQPQRHPRSRKYISFVIRHRYARDATATYLARIVILFWIFRRKKALDHIRPVTVQHWAHRWHRMVLQVPQNARADQKLLQTHPKNMNELSHYLNPL